VESQPRPKQLSLSAPQQMRIYAALELLVNTSSSNFLLHEVPEKRVSLDTVKGAYKFWNEKGRHPILDFKFDQTTLRDLTVANVNLLKFFGPSAENQLEIDAIMHNWRQLAHDMGIRTFCFPNTVVLAHINAAFSLLELFGAPPLAVEAVLGILEDAYGVCAAVSEFNARRAARQSAPTNPVSPNNKDAPSDDEMKPLSCLYGTLQFNKFEEYAASLDFMFHN
jgi:hypothetical protein